MPEAARVAYEPIFAADMQWQPNELGTEVCRLSSEGVIFSIVRGKAGDTVPAHSHSKGSVMFVVSGRIEVDGHELVHADGGKCNPGPGHYPTTFLEDSVYVVARPIDDEIVQPD